MTTLSSTSRAVRALQYWKDTGYGAKSSMIKDAGGLPVERSGRTREINGHVFVLKPTFRSFMASPAAYYLKKELHKQQSRARFRDQLGDTLRELAGKRPAELTVAQHHSLRQCFDALQDLDEKELKNLFTAGEGASAKQLGELLTGITNLGDLVAREESRAFVKNLQGAITACALEKHTLALEEGIRDAYAKMSTTHAEYSAGIEASRTAMEAYLDFVHEHRGVLGSGAKPPVVPQFSPETDTIKAMRERTDEKLRTAFYACSAGNDFWQQEVLAATTQFKAYMLTS